MYEFHRNANATDAAKICVMYTVIKLSVSANVKDGLKNLDQVILASKISQDQVPKSAR